ncbi:MAG TPA: lamin tail domain-containing protein [Clostridia bacterium]|nr:lamin tail domain-containing protein [Clostridia bacterium]
MLSRNALIIALALSLRAGTTSTQGACDTCVNFLAGTPWGVASVNGLTEASGAALSERNPGVLWTHNDGSRQRIFALSTNGALLASFNFSRTVQDVEDIAIGPGLVNGVSYLYVGDIGGNTGRDRVQILRIPEPIVDTNWASNPQSANFDSVESFTLRYPDGSYDAEALMVDSLTGDLIVATKQSTGTRLYRANLAEVPAGTTISLQLITSVPFGLVSGGDISADGRQIALRREGVASCWIRCDGESIAQAVARPGQAIPVIGPPAEPNGEAIAFLRDGHGYLTISEGENPGLYFFQSLCFQPPRFTLEITNQSTFAGGSAQFHGLAVGYPAPAYQWRFNGQVLAGKSTPSLTLSQLSIDQGGQYELIASNFYGTATSTATLEVRPKPDLRITEVQSSPAPNPSVPTADWWELTSFEAQPVDISGWRFNDQSGGLTDAFVFPNGLVIAPGESIVFVDGLTPLQFRNWWGSANLSTATQIVSYQDSGLSFGASGDSAYLWNNLATDPNDRIASVTFGASANGVTFNYNPVTGEFGQRSVLGVNGVFQAIASADIGSPGRILAPLVAPQLRSVAVGDKIRIEFDATVGRRYSLQARDDLGTGTWIATGDVFSATNEVTVGFEKERTANSRMYRLLVE